MRLLMELLAVTGAGRLNPSILAFASHFIAGALAGTATFVPQGYDPRRGRTGCMQKLAETLLGAAGLGLCALRANPTALLVEHLVACGLAIAALTGSAALWLAHHPTTAQFLRA